MAEVDRRRRSYLDSRPSEGVTGRVAIIVDDGIATGATVRAAIRGLKRRKPRKIILAVPVAPPDEIERLRKEADDIVCLESPEYFAAIGSFYEDFRQLTDEDVIRMMKSVPGAEAAAS